MDDNLIVLQNFWNAKLNREQPLPPRKTQQELLLEEHVRSLFGEIKYSTFVENSFVYIPFKPV